MTFDARSAEQKPITSEFFLSYTISTEPGSRSRTLASTALVSFAMAAGRASMIAVSCALVSAGGGVFATSCLRRTAGADIRGLFERVCHLQHVKVVAIAADDL